MEDRWKKTIAERACDIIDTNDLDPESVELLTPEMRPESYVRELCEAKKWPDAVKVMTRSLPPREGVWWACVCARQMQALSGDTCEIEALVAAEKWVIKPNDENRRKAFSLAQESTAKSAGTLCACAGPALLLPSPLACTASCRSRSGLSAQWPACYGEWVRRFAPLASFAEPAFSGVRCRGLLV